MLCLYVLLTMPLMACSGASDNQNGMRAIGRVEAVGTIPTATVMCSANPKAMLVDDGLASTIKRMMAFLPWCSTLCPHLTGHVHPV